VTSGVSLDAPLRRSGWWAEHGLRIKTAPIKSAYPLLTASARLPFLAAYADEPGPAMRP
jgi:hypothetical protein